MDDPAMPVHWGANQSGMQAKEELAGGALENAKEEWELVRNNAVISARKLNEIGLHKQIANRVVEPWMFITVLVTATELSNMRGLRVDPNAQPEFEHIARKMFEAYDVSTPRVLQAGQWHLPLVTGNDEEELIEAGFNETQRCFISCGRCARVSYLTHDGKRDPQADYDLSMGLLKNGHMSPFEHAAQALNDAQWTAHAAAMSIRWYRDRVPMGNLWGWKQFRKDIINEHDFSIVKDMRK
jgi:hypothetical protein